jgi:dipeptidyl aminopeptidase/acylaminoacyl peptidase
MSHQRLLPALVPCTRVSLARMGIATAVSAVVWLLVATAAHADGALNGRISFTSFRDAQLGDIWTIDPDGSDGRKVTSGPLYDAQSDWSRDGQSIAFRRGPNAFRSLQVWKMDLYGGNLALLATGDPADPTQNSTQPAWAPDGESLLFRATRPPYADSDIWRMNADGSNQALVVHIPGEQLYPSYSPDMSKIAYTTPLTPDDRAIFTIDASGASPPTKVFDVPGAYDSAPNWSPDGRQLAFESNNDGDMEIYTMNADGTDLRQLTNNVVHDEGPAWSPDGKRIVFTSGPNNLNGDIYVMNADGSARMRLMDVPGRDESPDWQPIPHAGDYVACGDVIHAGGGAYSVKRTGKGLDCPKAQEVAARWSDDALAGRRDDRVEGFSCATSDATYGALKVECTHQGNRVGDMSGGRNGNEKSILFVWRDS